MSQMNRFKGTVSAERDRAVSRMNEIDFELRDLYDKIDVLTNERKELARISGSADAVLKHVEEQ